MSLSVETYQIDHVTDTTPNSKLPVLVYRNVLSPNMTDALLSEEERERNAGELFAKNHWTPDVCIAAIPRM